MSWQTARRVEFQHCDPAGLVFYPRYFEMINSVIEEYFRDFLGYSFAPMHFSDGRGVPTAEISAEFHAPTRLEDMLNFSLETTHIGKSSAKFRIIGSCGSEKRLTVRSTLVRIDLERHVSDPWPADLAEKMRTT